MKFEMLFLAGGEGSRVKSICKEKGVEFKCKLKVPNQQETFLEKMLEHRSLNLDTKILVPKGKSNEFSNFKYVVEQKLPNFREGTSIKQRVLSYFSTQLGHTLTGYKMNNNNTHLIILPTDLYLPGINVEEFIIKYERLCDKKNLIGSLLIGKEELDYETHFLDMVLKVKRKTHFNPAIYIFPKQEISRFPLNLIYKPIILSSQASEVIDGGNPKTFE